MKASAMLFRSRMPVLVVIICLGFWAPWIQFSEIGARISLLEWLPLEIGRLGLLRFTVAAPAVIVCGALVAAVGAILRIWASAWLSPAVVLSSEMKAGSLLADGPYRYVRNPLYLGVFCMVAALSLLMPPSGALFVLLAVPAFLLLLIRGEEAFLLARIGENYRAYLLSAPRLFPRLRTALKPSGGKPRWPRAMLSELNPIGIFITLAFFSWTYDTRLMDRAVLVSFGISLVVRALLPRVSTDSAAAQ